MRIINSVSVMCQLCEIYFVANNAYYVYGKISLYVKYLFYRFYLKLSYLLVAVLKLVFVMYKYLTEPAKQLKYQTRQVRDEILKFRSQYSIPRLHVCEYI